MRTAGPAEYESSPRISIDRVAGRVTIRPDEQSILGKKLPRIEFHVESDGALGGDELLFDDHKPRGLPYFTIQSPPTNALRFTISGSLGVSPGGNINPDRTTPSMFEPIHGSAPDIAGKGIANPIASIWAGAMMLDHLGEHAAHESILRAIEHVIAEERVRTPDLGGRATTVDMTRAVVQALTAQPA